MLYSKKKNNQIEQLSWILKNFFVDYFRNLNMVLKTKIFKDNGYNSLRMNNIPTFVFIEMQ